jgi:glutaredoxin 2
MTFQDARQILSGGDTAATEYFKRTSTSQLAAAFKPAVHKSMQNVGVVQQYNRVIQNPMVAQVATGHDFSLDDYIVGKTLDGLFYVMGQEEQKIRKDPMKQTTAILREVFGKAATGGR